MFNCDECGKNPVDQYGLWCSECQQREYDLGMEAEGRWYNRSALCQECSNAWGPDPSDKCGAYNMPLDMVARKKKCKRFKPIIWNRSIENPETEVTRKK